MKQEAKAEAAAHQPSKKELEEDVSVNATPEALAWAVTRGGADRCANTQASSRAKSSVANSSD